MFTECDTDRQYANDRDRVMARQTQPRRTQVQSQKGKKAERMFTLRQTQRRALWRKWRGPGDAGRVTGSEHSDWGMMLVEVAKVRVHSGGLR